MRKDGGDRRPVYCSACGAGPFDPGRMTEHLAEEIRDISAEEVGYLCAHNIWCVLELAAEDRKV